MPPKTPGCPNDAEPIHSAAQRAHEIAEQMLLLLDESGLVPRHQLAALVAVLGPLMRRQGLPRDMAIKLFIGALDIDVNQDAAGDDLPSQN